MIERHIITGEYPPALGGVGDHTAVLARALAAQGERVHVWCRGASGSAGDGSVEVHRKLGSFDAADLARFSAALDRLDVPRRLLVQWVPHAYGRRSLNVTFARWLLRRRARDRDEIDVIVHEPFLPLRGGIRVMSAAVVHRLMLAYVLRSAARVWVTTTAWNRCIGPYAPKRDLGLGWLPVPSTVPCHAQDRQRFAASREVVVGAFPTGEVYADRVLADCVLPALARSESRLLLIGRRSAELRARLVESGSLASRIDATGEVDLAELSRAIARCDIAVQPYADGVCGRRTTAMAFLAHGRPLVTSDGRFTEDVWRGGGVALVPAMAPRGFTEMLDRLVSHVGERERLASAGRELYDARFDVRHTAAALHEASC